MIAEQTKIMFVLYIAAMLLIGWLGYRATKNLSDYILGGRSLGSWVTALSAGASDMSGWLLMGLPGAIYAAGFSEAWIAIGLVIGAWLNWLLVAGRLRIYTEQCNNSLTLPDFLTHRFEDKHNILRIVTAFVILIFFTLYCASGVVAGARLFEKLFEIDYSKALWIGALATIAYVFVGGFLAVSWTDTIQATLMILALLLVPMVVVYQEGWVPIIDTMRNDYSSHFQWFPESLSSIGLISLLAWGLGYVGQPHILVRFMAAESASVIPKARRVGMTWMILCLMGAVAIGWIGRAYFHINSNSTILNNNEMVFVELSRILFHPLIAGILLASMLAAVMSTLSCQLLLCASTLTQDIYHTFFDREATQNTLVWLGRAMVLMVALVAMFLARNPENSILKMVEYAWAGFGASFGPVVLGALFWRHMTRNGALAGILVGAATVMLWKDCALYLAEQIHINLVNLNPIVPGFILASIAMIVFSLLDNKPSEGMVSRFDEVEEQMKHI
jgi:sodium/proline symporter